MQKLYTLGLLVFLVLLVGCDSSTGPGTVTIPLHEGNTWIYKFSRYDSTGILVNYYFDTVRLGAATSINGETWYPLLHSPVSSVQDSQFVTNRADGLWTLTKYLGLDTTFISRTYKYSAVVNDTLNLHITSGFPGPGVMEKSFTMTAATNEQVTIPLGTFSCVHNRSYFQRLDSLTKEVLSSQLLGDQFYNHGIGEIKFSFQTSRLVGPPDSIGIETFDNEKTLVGYSFK